MPNSNHTPEQLAALAQLEDNVAIWQQGCIGTTRKENNAKALVGSWSHVKELGVETALTNTEHNAVRDAASYIGFKLY